MVEWTEVDSETGQTRPVELPDELSRAIMAGPPFEGYTRRQHPGPRNDPDDRSLDYSGPNVGEFTD